MLTIAGGIILAVIGLFVGFFVLVLIVHCVAKVGESKKQYESALYFSEQARKNPYRSKDIERELERTDRL